MLSRPTRLLVLVLAVLSLAGVVSAAAQAKTWHGEHGRTDRRASFNFGGGVNAQIVSPSSGSTVSGTVRWEVAVSGASSPKVTFTVDGSRLTTVTGRTPSVALNTNNLSEGRHTLAVTATNGSHSDSDKVT